MSSFICTLFGYNDDFEFHGPLEIIFSYLDIFENISVSFKVCKNFYLASVESFWKRNLKDSEFEIMILKKPSESLLLKFIKSNMFVKKLQMDRIILLCSMKGYTDSVKLLVKQNYDPSSYGDRAIRYASQGDHYDLVKFLLSDERVDPSSLSNSTIRYAIENGYSEIVKLLLSDKRVDPSGYKNRNLMLACKNGHYEIVKILLKDNRVVNNHFFRCDYLINKAHEQGHANIVELLERKKKEMDELKS